MSVDPASVKKLLLVTGLSGAGKTSVLKRLEDMGYEAVDNPPLALLPPLLASYDDRAATALAVGVDCRSHDFRAEDLLRQLEGAQKRGWQAQLVFIDADDDALLRRFTATRRRHPLAHDRSVMDGIALERGLLQSLKRAAHQSLDTSQMSLPDLRDWLAGHFALSQRPRLAVQVLSFSYRLGLPREADLVFDARFLKNPHYVEALRPLTGVDVPVGQFIMTDPAFTPFFGKMAEMLLSLLPHYGREGKQYLTIAVGCTGGRHRSVFVAEKLARLLTDEGYDAMLRHRDKDKDEQ